MPLYSYLARPFQQTNPNLPEIELIHETKFPKYGIIKAGNANHVRNIILKNGLDAFKVVKTKPTLFNRIRFAYWGEMDFTLFFIGVRIIFLILLVTLTWGFTGDIQELRAATEVSPKFLADIIGTLFTINILIASMFI